MRRPPLPAKYRLWLLWPAAVCGIFAIGAALLGRDPLGPITAAVFGVFLGLVALGVDTSSRPVAQLLFRVLTVVLIVLTLY